MTSFVDRILANLTEDELWEVRDRISAFVKNVTYPEVIVYVVEPDSIKPHLACPRCASTDSIQEVDESDRWNPVEGLVIASDGVVVACIDTADSNFQTVAYLCSRCLLPCELPSWIEQVWS